MRLANKGFTLVELLIAMSFFSFLLLFVTMGFIQVNRSYNRGVTVKTIQESARSLIEDITRSIRTTENVTYLQVPNGGFRLCFSGSRIIWNQHQEDTVPPIENSLANFTSEKFSGTTEEFTLVRSEDGAACAAPVAQKDAESILDNRAAVQHLSVSPISGGAFKLVLVISTRDAMVSDLAEFGKNAVCKIKVGDQFCDVAKFETSVKIRN